MKVRTTAVAGQFYPAEKQVLLKQLNQLFKGIKREEKDKAQAVIVPHAGYFYSGKIAARAFACLEKKKTFVILSPNHTGLGERISISDADYWETPLGKVKINKKLSRMIAAKIGELDELAHIGEHSIEVQLPLLQYLFEENFSVVAITIMEHSMQTLMHLGEVLAELNKNNDIGIIVSSDFTHFETEERAKELDLKAIKFIEQIDAEGFHSFVEERNLSICGYVAITALLEYCKRKELKAKLLKYGSSADANKERSSVVGYAAIAFFAPKKAKNSLNHCNQ